MRLIPRFFVAIVLVAFGLCNVGDLGLASAASAATRPLESVASSTAQGYWLAASDGGIFNYGAADFYGSSGALALNKPIVAMAATPDGLGYWLVASDGGIFNYGDAAFYGSSGALALNKPIVAMAATPDGKGYWLVASDGGIFNYGDAAFYGSSGALHLNKPIVGMAATPDGKGYWLVASDGGIFNYGDAAFYGSTGALHLNEPIVGMAATPDGQGYWLVASDGGIFTYGDAAFYGSTGSLALNRPIVGMATTPDGQGYRLVASDGGIFTYGDAAFYGSTGSLHLNKPIVAIGNTPASVSTPAAATQLGGSTTPTTPTTSSGPANPLPATPSATGAAMCGSTTLHSPYSYAGATGGPYSASTWASMIAGGDSLPPLTNYPGVSHGVIINSSSWPASYAMATGTLYYVEPGDQGNLTLSPLTDDVIVGGYNSTSGEAELDSDFADQYSMSDMSGSYAGDALTTLYASASAGSTSIQTRATVLAGWGIEFADGTKYRVTAVSGSSAPYTYTLDHPLEANEASGATVDYNSSGNVTVSYLTIERFTGAAIDVQDFRDPGWVVSYDTLTLNNNTTPTSQPSGDGFDGNGTISNDCISDNGQHGLNMFGIGGVVSHDDFTGNGTHLDEGCGCVAAVHGWQTTNLTVSSNYFDADLASNEIWLDTDNTGYLISGNYFYQAPVQAVTAEISYNGKITDNNFVDTGWADQRGQYPDAVYLNNTGGQNIPGSNYNDSVSIDHNQFKDDWGEVGFYGENDRSCMKPSPFLNYGDTGTSYCTGTDPASFDGLTYGGSYNNDTFGLVAAASAGATSIQTGFEYSVGDQIGFSLPTYVNYGGSSISNLQTAFTGSQTLAMPSLTGFSSGQVFAETSSGYAVLSYTGTATSPSDELTGVSYVRGAKGTLAPSVCNSSCQIMSIEPYTVTSVSGHNDGTYALSPNGVYTEGITPALASNESTGAGVSGMGTCFLYDVEGAGPSGPSPESLGFGSQSISYFDGCKWPVQNVSVTSNDFSFTPSDIYHASNPSWVGSTDPNDGDAYTFTPSDCNTANYLDPNDAPPTGNSYQCGYSLDEYQPTAGTGGAAPGPYGTAANMYAGPDAQVSDSSFSAPLNNLNNTSYGGAGEAPGNNIWSGNTYSSDLTFEMYLQTGATSGSTPAYACGSVIDSFQPVCYVDPSQWSSIWQQG